MSGSRKLTLPDPQAALRAAWKAAFRARREAEAQLLAAGCPRDLLGRALARIVPVNMSWFTALRCGARTKSSGQPCKSKAIYECGRCRLHGGLSTGPLTPAGRARVGRRPAG